jgi:hypothetical protein
MLNPDPTNQPTPRRPARNSKFLIALIVIAAILVASQYTRYAPFPSEQTSMLWGILTGLVVGGLIFGWLKKPWL